MKFSKYVKDKALSIMIAAIKDIVIFLLMVAFKSKLELVVAVMIILITFYIILLLDFYRRKKFYDFLLYNLQNLDKKYLIQEIINRPDFYEGKIFYDALFEINKSMIEHINHYKYNINEFKEYVEMWIHEVKIPISSLVLINHNNKDNKKYQTQISKLDNYIDQILYYVRSENVEKDFMIKEVSLPNIIRTVALKNKDMILDNVINLEVNVDEIKVLSDEKWLEFILNQIINNSIKYKKEKDAIIRISATENESVILLSIYDNGIGIIGSDLPRIFEKSFTGENGRIKTKSTGMGLYIVKKLCDKLGHSISVQSNSGEYTNVIIGFEKNDFFKI